MSANLSFGPDSIVGGDTFDGGLAPLGQPFTGIGFSPANSIPPRVNWNSSPPGLPAAFNHAVDTTFDLRLTFGTGSALPPQPGQPYLEISGRLRGAVFQNGTDYNVSGGFSGTGSSATLHNGTPGSGLPLSLINPLLDASRFHVQGEVAGPGTDNEIYLKVTIDPVAVPVPEPATVFSFSVLAAALALRRFMGSRRLS